ncbi:MAG: glycosyltransferase family 2 protein [Parvularculaceae bacterium]
MNIERTPKASISVIVPAFNEAESLEPLFAEIAAVMGRIGAPFEAIFVDDGSTDATGVVLARLAASAPMLRVIEFRRNFGKAAALDAGFRAATGDVVITMDADLQDDPAEIPKLLEMIGAGYEAVSGWKKKRLDPLDKRAPSKLFNAVVSRLSGVALNDFNCGFKAYTAEAVEGLHLYGELHRFIPVLLHWRGFKVGEIVVNHRAREFGKSKYGAGRLFKGALDLLTVILNTRFQTRPLHVFGGAGAIMGAAGVAILLYLTALWFIGDGPIGNRPLLFFGILLSTSSLQFFTVGLLAEFIQRQSVDGRPHWLVRRTRNLETLESLNPEIRRLKRAAAALKEADQWPASQERPFATTPATAIVESTRTAIPSSG